MQTPSEQRRKSLAEQAAAWHEQLKAADGGEHARDYLAARGIHPHAIDRFQLGWDGERLTIPYLTPVGAWFIKRRCVTCAGKCEGHPKYLNDRGASLHLFNAQTLLGDVERVVIAEGEIDTITLEQAGVPTVGIPGVDAWRANPHFVWTLDSVAEVIVVMDGDDAGQKCARSVVDSIRTRLPDTEVRNVAMPDGFDVNSFVCHEDEMSLLDLIGVL